MNLKDLDNKNNCCNNCEECNNSECIMKQLIKKPMATKRGK